MLNSTIDKVEARALVESVPIWCHSFDFAPGITTSGTKSREMLASELRALQLPPLAGKTVLDIGAFDGFFSFEAERQGAAQVTALDYYAWSMDLVEHHRHWKDCVERGESPEPYHLMPYWQPNKLPGKRGFDVASRLLGSNVRAVVGDFMTVDLDALGSFDVVLFFGVLYHLEDPFKALKRLAQVTREVAIIETEAIYVRGHGSRALYEFFPTNELNHDVSNWWAPNQHALESMCLAAGFSRVESVQAQPGYIRRLPSRLRDLVIPRVHRYRAIVHAFR